MDSYFKILRAWEEIQQLNIEIKCVVTWIDDEARFLRKKEEELKRTDPPPHCLGLPISPTMQPIRRIPHAPVLGPREGRDRWEQERSGDWEDEVEDEGEEAREENVAALMYQMLVLAVDCEETNGANPGLS
ncbi:hypothetical protein B0H14DRAFT_2598225 [Mycena olivaceomarginata]|nr:hypothetical protein B0H14DRAFT_2598225 [Mycena olivaceomarginata]